MFQILGYDVFNPLEFVPEYTADIGIKKGEKVDYAILDENKKPLILIEAKWCGENLEKHADQLIRYFSVTDAKFAILTNGIKYMFYTDLDEPNIMDEKPFLIFDLSDIRENLVNEVKKFQKAHFDIDTVFNTASELKYNSQIKATLLKELLDPSEDFITFIINDIYQGRKTQKIICDFHDIVKKSFQQFINDQLNDRLKSALGTESNVEILEDNSECAEHSEKEDTIKSKIVTTQDEIESYFIIKTMLHDTLQDHKITYKDTETYFGILIDGNIRKWLCRLKLGEKRKLLILPSDNREQIKIHLSSVDDLYNYKEELINVINNYLGEKNG